jgi:F-type H+-transporting ATPase subunit b
MLIDWFTVGAQALNFVVLVWLLKHFLYRPILDAIDAREKGIADRLADANGKTADAQKQREEFDAKDRTFDEQRAALLTRATADAKTEHDRLIDEAQKEGEALRATQAAALKTDGVRLEKQLAGAACDEVFAIARKALSDLAGASLEERMGAVFTQRLSQMDSAAKQTLGSALKNPANTAVVQSAFEMPAAQQAAIRNALNETFSADVRVRFETAPDGVCGIELTAGGQKTGWSIAEYLTALNRRVAVLLDAR